MSERHDNVRPIRWREGALELLDQRLLPDVERYRCYADCGAVAAAIAAMVVRGAPAIGIAAAYAVAMAAREHYTRSPEHWREGLAGDLTRLRAARPTAVNLRWAVDRMWACAAALEGDPSAPLLATARDLHERDIAANRILGDLGAALIERGSAVLTHCNAGSLATGGYGTALGVIRSAYAEGRLRRVYADETRPWLQGSRLTAWELLRDGVPVTVLADGAAAALMAGEGIDWLIVGADRIAANGDVANKIGTYMAALAARHHGVRVMVAAPISTIDLQTADESGIPIEHRAAEEVMAVAGQRVGAVGATVWNPVFDVTPAALIDAIVTERGVLTPPFGEGIRALLGEGA